jgi:hypothetical protein
MALRETFLVEKTRPIQFCTREKKTDKIQSSAEGWKSQVREKLERPRLAVSEPS